MSSPAYEAPVFSPSGALLYVSLYNENKIIVIDTTTRAVVSSFSVNSPTGLAINKAGTRLYAANNLTNTVSVIDTTNQNVIATVATGHGPSQLAVTPDDAYVYISNNQSGNTISVLETSTNSVIATLSVSASPLR